MALTNGLNEVVPHLLDPSLNLQIIVEPLLNHYTHLTIVNHIYHHLQTIYNFHYINLAKHHSLHQHFFTNFADAEGVLRSRAALSYKEADSI